MWDGRAEVPARCVRIDLPRSLPAVPGSPGTAGIDVVYIDPSCFPSFALRLCLEVQATGMSIQSEAMDD